MMIEGVPGSTAKDQSRAKTNVLKEKIITGCTGTSPVGLGAAFGGG